MLLDHRHNPVDLYVASQIRTRRKLLGLTQKALAKSLGVTFQQIQKYEKGLNRVSASKLYTIAKYLNTDISNFFLGLKDSDYNNLDLKEDKKAYISKEEEVRLANERDFLVLRSYYSKIIDPKLRKKILDLVKQIAQ